MNWEQYKEHCHWYPNLEFTIDCSRVGWSHADLSSYAPMAARAWQAMQELENGAIANPDEQRQVGHYWLRNSDLAPSPETTAAIEATKRSIFEFAGQVHSGAISSAKGKFTDLLVIGIGGSALGPQFLAHALGSPREDKLGVWFLDNTDPDGFDLVFQSIGDRLHTTLFIVISKSGGTPETRNGMVETRLHCERHGIGFASQAVAITGVGSKLDKMAAEEKWLERFPMWDWVGGRTSVTGPVGLLPAALQGVDTTSFLSGAAAMDQLTREEEPMRNPAMTLALAWYHLTDGRGSRDMVILPYKDRLLLFSRYLQQLIMESLGKELDLQGNRVHQGIAVYGNKGSTDQHAYVQQLREGVANFFATFIEVLQDRGSESPFVEGEVTSGDFLMGFLLGTREALSENNRPSITLTIPKVNAFTVGQLIALYERAVGFYASFVDINAYHQPGVEAGKKAASAVLEVQGKILEILRKEKGTPFTAQSLANRLAIPEKTEWIHKILLHLHANRPSRIGKNNSINWLYSTYFWK